MQKRKLATQNTDRLTELIRDLIIVQLSLAGVGQREIRNIVGGDINRINRIAKNLRKKDRRVGKEG